MADRVLITGISGFIAAHIAHRLLDKGYQVRGTVRNLDKGNKVIEALVAAGTDVSKLELVEADLGADDGWKEAVTDCRYIQHIASPLPNIAPSDREALVPEARAGAQRVLEHGFSEGAEHIVMTSSIAAMIGQRNKKGRFDFGEEDWTDPDWKAQQSYAVSKTRAELSAWSYVDAEGFRDKLTVINPGLVFGPDTYGNGGASLQLIRGMMIGGFPRLPKMGMPIVDIRDCAAIHVAAMTSKKCGGRRLIASAESLWMKDIADILRAEYPDQKQIPKDEFPNAVVKLSLLFDDRMKPYVPDLGVMNVADTSYVSALTKVLPRPAKEAILETAKSLIEQGKVRLD